MKKHVLSTYKNLKNGNITDEQSVWEYLKYQIREISKKNSEEAVHSNKIESSALEAKLKTLESKIRFRDDPEYIPCKEKLQKLYHKVL